MPSKRTGKNRVSSPWGPSSKPSRRDSNNKFCRACKTTHTMAGQGEDAIQLAESGGEDSSEGASAAPSRPEPAAGSRPSKAPKKKRKKAEAPVEKQDDDAKKRADDGDGDQEGDDGEAKDGDDNIAALTGDKDQEYESRLADARNKFLLSQLSPEQQQRYEFFRRSGFQRSTIKKVMQNVANTPISQTMAIVMAGISKVYVGELVETARGVMDEWGDPAGPLQPRHIREAYRRLKQTNSVPSPARSTKRLFRK